jgi:UDP-N-acetylglucosamine transferase subunit ALG13
MRDAPPFVVVSTGTDKRYRFDRLIEWLEAWDATHPGAADVCIQWGISRPSRLPGAEQYNGDELDALLQRADAVVVQGGPGGIVRSRRHGIQPIVVPRDGSLGEHVDDHQIKFATWAAARDLVVHARTSAELDAALDVILRDRDAYRIEPDEPSTAATVARFTERVGRLWSTGR